MCKKSKIIVIFGCLCFFIVTCSRVSQVHNVKQSTLSEWDQKQIKISRLKKMSGEFIEFSKKERGYIDNDLVIGTGKGSTRIDAENVAKEVYDYGYLKGIVAKDNKEYEVIYRDDAHDCYWIQDSEYQMFEIPLSEIGEIVVKKRGRAVGSGVLSSLAIGGALGFIASLSAEEEGGQAYPIGGASYWFDYWDCICFKC